MKIKTLILSLMILSTALTASAQIPKPKEENPLKNYADSQVVEFFTSKDMKESAAAATELFSRGDRVIPELLKLEGNDNCFYGLRVLGRRGDPGSHDYDYVCDGDEKVSVEIAALYVISAIFAEDLKYRRRPYLHHIDDGDDGNSPENIKTAWKATKKWYKLVKQQGIEYIRGQSQWPLRSAGMRF